jgi:hypothetical protein
MKMGSKHFGSMILGLCASIGCAGLLQAQVTNVTWRGTVGLVTTNNVTYAEFMWPLFGFLCENVVGTGPLVGNDSNFWYNFELTEPVTPMICPQFVANITTTVPLGTLAPGTYTLTTTSWGVPVMTNTFTIPTSSTPILYPVGFCTNGSFEIQMSNCDSNMSYVLECSTNLVNWTSLSTNSGGPPLMDPSPVLPGPCYYRVQILQR